MKFSYPDIKKVFDTDEGINCLIIENQHLFYDICIDISNQLEGEDGKAVVSIDDQPIDVSKNVELLMQFVPFNINKKALLTRLCSVTERIAVSPEYYEMSMEQISGLEKFLIEITNQLTGSIVFSKMTINNLIKSAGLEFEEDYSSLAEALIDYMELVRQYDKEKLFFLVNLRSYISDEECELFFDTVRRKDLKIMLIESSEHTLLGNEKRYIIDGELCEIS